MIYVTPMAEFSAPDKWRWRTSAMCFADTQEELMGFAENQLNIRVQYWLEWFNKMPFCRLDRKKREKALSAGATELNLHTPEWFTIVKSYK